MCPQRNFPMVKLFGSCSRKISVRNHFFNYYGFDSMENEMRNICKHSSAKCLRNLAKVKSREMNQLFSNYGVEYMVNKTRIMCQPCSENVNHKYMVGGGGGAEQTQFLGQTATLSSDENRHFPDFNP